MSFVCCCLISFILFFEIYFPNSLHMVVEIEGGWMLTKWIFCTKKKRNWFDGSSIPERVIWNVINEILYLNRMWRLKECFHTPNSTFLYKTNRRKCFCLFILHLSSIQITIISFALLTVSNVQFAWTVFFNQIEAKW